MKNLAILFFFFSFLLIGCLKNDKNVTPTKTQQTVELTQEKYDSLSLQAIKAESLQDFFSTLEKNPDFFLLLLDSELKATERGEETYGSFSDFFVPRLHDALIAGAPKEEVMKRVNKMIKLAKKGLFVSSFEQELFDRGGTAAILGYIGI